MSSRSALHRPTPAGRRALDHFNTSPGLLRFARQASLVLCLGLPGLATASPVSQLNEPVAPTEQTLLCGQQSITVNWLGRLATVTLDGQTQVLAQAIAASGARFVGLSDPDTELWNRGAQSRLTWSGTAFPTCAPAGTLVIPYRASGNEPFWQVRYDGWQLTLSRPGEPPREFDASITETRTDGQTLSANEADLSLHTRTGICQDSMTGMPHPDHATLQYQGQTLIGCGGDPARLLQGAAWQVTQIDEQPVLPDSQPTLQFLDERVAGQGSCNRYTGQFELTGESLTFGGIATTRMACDTELMDQEDRFLQALGAVRGFRLDDPRTLILEGGERSVTATLRE